MIEFGFVDNSVTHDTIVIVGGGRSLIGFQFKRLIDTGYYIITVNDSGKIIPFANAWFTLDPWGLCGPQLPCDNFTGTLYAAVPSNFGTPGAISSHQKLPTAKITYLHRVSGKTGLSENTDTIHTGNSGYGALGLAYHMRPRRILLLGIDGDIGYYYTKRKNNRELLHLPALFEQAVPQLQERNIDVINGSPNSTVTCFQRCTPSRALKIMEK